MHINLKLTVQMFVVFTIFATAHFAALAAESKLEHSSGFPPQPVPERNISTTQPALNVESQISKQSSDPKLECLQSRITISGIALLPGDTSWASVQIHNGLDWPISGIRYARKVTSKGRAVPWIDKEDAMAIPGGVEPGETRTLNLWIGSVPEDAISVKPSPAQTREQMDTAGQVAKALASEMWTAYMCQNYIGGLSRYEMVKQQVIQISTGIVGSRDAAILQVDEAEKKLKVQYSNSATESLFNKVGADRVARQRVCLDELDEQHNAREVAVSKFNEQKREVINSESKLQVDIQMLDVIDANSQPFIGKVRYEDWSKENTSLPCKQ